MSLLSAAIDAPPDSFDLLGSPAQTSVVLRNAATITPAGQAPTTVPAGTFAALRTAPTAKAVWDRTAQVMVLYAVPGDTHLYAVAEADLATVAGDAAPLARVLRHAVVLSPAQAGAGGGAILGSGLEYVIDGGGAAIGAGVAGTLVLPFAATLTSVQLLADQAGSIVVDIYKCTYAGYPPTAAASICAAAKPTLSSAQKYQDTTLTGWTTAINPGDILVFNVDSAATITRCNVVLDYARPAETNALEYLLDGGGAVLATGVQGEMSVPWDCTITGCTLLADQSGSLQLDLQRSSYAGYPAASSIVASAPPAISAAQKSQDLALAGWTKTLSAGDVIAVSVTSVTSIQRCALALSITRSDGGGKAAPAVGALAVDHGGTLVGTRPTLNLIDGTGTTLTVADNAGTDSVDVTVAAGSGGGTAAMPSVKAYSTVAHTVPANGTLNLPFEGTDHDEGATSAQHSTSVNPERLTCQQAGVYQINGTVKIVIDSTVSAGHLEFFLQRYTSAGVPTENIAAEFVEVIGGRTQNVAVTLSGQSQLNVGDYVELEIDSVVSAALTTSYSSASTEFPSISWTQVAGSASTSTTATAPAVKAYSNALNGTSIAAGAQLSAVAFELTQVDQGTTSPQHDNVTNNSRIVCQVSGLYQVFAFVALNCTTASAAGLAINRLNAGGWQEYVVEQSGAYAGTGGGTLFIAASELCPLTAGDYLTLDIDNTGSTAVTIQAPGGATGNHYPNLAMVKVG